MKDLIDRLMETDDELGALVRDGFDAVAAGAGSPAEVAALLQVAGSLFRHVDGLLAAVTSEVQGRSAGDRDERLTTHLGCRDVAELLRRTTLCDSRQAAVWARAAQVVQRDVSITSGEPQPGMFPALREALLDGAVTASGVAHATAGLRAAMSRIDPAELAVADRVLAAAARGVAVEDIDDAGLVAGGSDAVTYPPMDAHELKILADALVTRLDQDGSEPVEEKALRGRSFSLGRLRPDGLVPVKGMLMPEVAGQLQTLQDAVLNPHGEDRTAGVRFIVESSEAATDADAADGPPRDDRTYAQRTHDAFAVILGIASRAADAPTLGGAAPTLVVTVSAEDLAAGRWAYVDGIGSVPAAVARQVACCGSVQQVIHDRHGRIVQTTIADRVFNALQRRAIIARDGTCVIPGCTVPARWCEIHHVQPHAHGGATSVDNGVPLCFFHHRTIDKAGWDVTMEGGVPMVRGPVWWDPQRRRRRVRASRITGFAGAARPKAPPTVRRP
jgi:hypothetical protein